MERIAVVDMMTFNEIVRINSEKCQFAVENFTSLHSAQLIRFGVIVIAAIMQHYRIADKKMIGSR